MLADFDAVAPTASFRTVTTSRTKPGRARVVVALRAADDVAGNAVSYVLEIRAGARRVARATGEAAEGTARVALTPRVPTHTGALKVVLELLDPVGNSRTIRRTVRLRR